MKNRIWYELCQRKHDHYYCLFLLAKQKRLLNYFNIAILTFSAGGVMGWKFWDDLPTLSCVIIAIISLMKLLGPHIIPSEKQIDKLDMIVDFQFDYYNKVEQLWYDHYNGRIQDAEAQKKFYELKNTEREINKTINEIIKSVDKKIKSKTDTETRQYLKLTFNLKS